MSKAKDLSELGGVIVTDGSGNVLVGKTTTSDATTTVGFHVQPIGVAVLTRDGGAPLRVSRKTSDGEIISFHKDGTTVGRVGAFSNSTSYCGASSGIYFNGANINPTTGDPTVRTDNANDIGQASQRFKDLYLGGGVYLGGTGDANKLDDYEEGTWAPSSPVNCTINSVYSGYYIKIGSLVHAYCYINLTTSSITFAFGGLPFSSLGYGPATRYYPAGQAFNGHSYVESGASIMRNDSTSTFTNLNVMFSATYRTT